MHMNMHMIGALTRTAQNSRLRLYIILLMAPCLLGIQVPLSPAQVTTAITSSGLNTTVNQVGAIHEITGGTRPGGGPNLFHSFGEFSIGVADTALFKSLPAEPATSNILGRVTGGLPSQIYGTIDSVTHYPGANLFLINPAGMVFGAGATLSVGGSVSFTTADYIRLFDGENSANFYANPASDGLANSVLSLAPLVNFGFLTPAAYGFLNPPDPAATITVQGSTLMVPAGQSFTLAGGDITLMADPDTGSPASIQASGGKINLASVASPGEILTGTLDQAPNVNGQSFGALGTIQVSQQSVLDTSGDGGGTVVIRGGRFVLNDSTISANTTGPAVGEAGGGINIAVAQDAAIENGAVLETNVSGNATPDIQYGGVTVKADRIEIVGSQDFENFPFTGIFSDVAQGSTGGHSGGINLEANSILVKDFGTFTTIVGTTTMGAGNSGNIILRTNGNLEIDVAEISTTSLFASGNGGNIELTSTDGNIFMTGAFVSSSAFSTGGSAGSIRVSAPHGDILLNDFTQLFNRSFRGAGIGGIQIDANNLQLNGSAIGGDNFDPLLPGSIALTLSGSLSLSDSFINTVSRGLADAANLIISAHDISITGGSFLSTETRSSGSGGQLDISTETLQLTNGGQIRSGSRLGVDPVTGEPIIPSGTGGTITVQGLASPAESVLIDGPGSGILTNAEGTGAGGSMNVSAQSVKVQNGGTLSAATSGTAASATGGTIMVNAGTVQLNSGAMITAESTGLGDAGSITLTTTGNTVTLSGGSRISSSSTGTMADAGNAGSVTLTSSGPFRSNASTVATSAENGKGGNISISGQDVQLSNGTSISASSAGLGDAGNITINADGTFLSENSSVTTQSTQAGGGDISIKASDMVQLINSQINTSVAGGEGGGGNITIDPNFTILQNSQILAQAFAGQGGNINITTGVFLADASSLVDASSQFGLSGTVTIQSPTSNLSSVWARLQQNYVDVAALVRARCAAQVSGQYSSFVQAGRDAVPLEPGGWLLSPMAALSAGEGPGARGEGARSVIESSVLASEGGILSIRGFDQNLSWPGLVQAPRRFVSILDSACGS